MHNFKDNMDLLSSIRKLKQQNPIEKPKKQQADQRPRQLNQQKPDLEQSEVKRGIKSHQRTAAPKDLFKNLTFCFPIFSAELTKLHAEAVKKTIQDYGGKVYDFTDLKDEAQVEDEIAYVDFMLVGPSTLRENVQQLTDKGVIYQNILDFNYIFRCKDAGKILKFLKFIIPYKSKQLQQYMKHKELEVQLQKQLGEEKSARKIYLYEPGTGIEPLNVAQSHSIMSTKQHLCYNRELSQAFQRLKSLNMMTERSKAYLYGIIARILIRPSTPRIFTQQDADKLSHLKFIGPKTIIKIKEYIRNGCIEKAEIMAGKEKIMICSKLEKIYGIGKIKAENFYEKGIRSIQNLRESVESGMITLTKNQLAGLKYYQELNTRIPYDKVTKIFEFVKKQLYEIAGSDNYHNIQACGSYRRKKQTCGDIDIIISRKDGHYEKDLLMKLVTRLTQVEFLTDHLTNLKKTNQTTDNSISFMGICKFQSQIHHRIDFKYYPLDQYPFAILYFTGSQKFNINMRNHALRQGYTLTDHGMWEVERMGKNLIPKGPAISFINEEEIFTFLGLKYKRPEERSV